MHVDLTLLHSCTSVSLVTELLCALDHSSNACALAQGSHKIELHLSWYWSAVERHRKWSRLETLEIRGSNSSRMVASRYGHHSRPDDVQIRQEMADFLQRVREDMHTAINGRLDAISSISSAMEEALFVILSWHPQELHRRDEQVRRKVWENPRRREDSGSEKVDAQEFAELSIPCHHVVIRRIAHGAGEHHHRQGHDTLGI